MNEGVRRFLVLLAVFFLAFAAVFAFRRIQSGEGLFSFLKGEKEKEQFAPESYTLPEEPALEPGDVKWLSRLNAEYAKLTEAVVPSVVSLHVEGIRSQRVQDLWGRRYERRAVVQGSGSGVIVSKEGHVVTNHHVVEGEQSIRVTLHDGKTYDAIVIGQDRNLDIAVLRIKAKEREFQPLKFGDSDRVRRGDLVFAVGNPFELGETITQGIISARERTLSDTQPNLFQTDAAINPGNSGGPLVNIYGEIIGINNAIYSPDTEARGFHGIGFSIPSNDVFDSFTQILERGRPIRGYLGIQVAPDEWGRWWRNEVGYEAKNGEFVLQVVPGSPAAKAGLQRSDVVVEYDGHAVESRLLLFTLIQRSKVGEDVIIKVWRKGEYIDLRAGIIDAEKAQPLTKEEPAKRTATEEEIAWKIGLTVDYVTPRIRVLRGRGVVVRNVREGSLAWEARLRPGDLILAVNRVICETPNEFYARLLASAAVQDTTIVFQRENQEPKALQFPKIERLETEPEPAEGERPER